jgi:hypothetical protein
MAERKHHLLLYTKLIDFFFGFSGSNGFSFLSRFLYLLSPPQADPGGLLPFFFIYFSPTFAVQNNLVVK